jgi:hypothetical protein
MVVIRKREVHFITLCNYISCPAQHFCYCLPNCTPAAVTPYLFTEMLLLKHLLLVRFPPPPPLNMITNNMCVVELYRERTCFFSVLRGKTILRYYKRLASMEISNCRCSFSGQTSSPDPKVKTVL